MHGNDVHTLIALLDRSVARVAGSGETIGVAFSGGLDSGVLAFIALRHARIHAYTVATDRGKKDVLTAQDAASSLGIESTLIIPSYQEIQDAVKMVKIISGARGRFLLSILIPIWFVLKRADEEIILDGQGADELFGGYSRYLRMKRDVLTASLESDVKKALDLARYEDALATHLGKRLHHPFLSNEIISYALSLSPERKVSNGSRKVILREAGYKLGLPSKIFNAEKKAIQYGSGMEKALKQMGVEE